MKPNDLTRVAALVAAASLIATAAIAAEHRLTLDEAIDRALTKNEELLIERESAAAANAAVGRAKGAYGSGRSS